MEKAPHLRRRGCASEPWRSTVGARIRQISAVYSHTNVYQRSTVCGTNSTKVDLRKAAVRRDIFEELQPNAGEAL